MFPFPSDWHEVTGTTGYRCTIQNLYDSGVEELAVGETKNIVLI